MRHLTSIAIALTAAIPLVAVPAGCGTNEAQRTGTGGAAVGAGIGAILGGWEGAAIGAAVGGGTGYMIGNEQDKAKAQAQADAEKERQVMRDARVESGSSAAYRPTDANPLMGSSWQMISVQSDGVVPDYHSVVVTFTSSSSVTTIMVLRNGTTKRTVEQYRVQANTLVIMGKHDEVRARYAVADGQMVVTAPDMTVVLEAVASG